MAFGVLETISFSKVFGTIEKEEQEWIKKMIKKLEQNPFTGKPLGYAWFREKKFKGKRLYYIIYEKQQKVLLVGFGVKKDQQKMIAGTLENMETYKKIIEEKLVNGFLNTAILDIFKTILKLNQQIVRQFRFFS